MPEEIPQFSSTPVEDQPKKKAAARRRPAASRGKTPRAKNRQEIAKNLTAIYAEGGHLPDMKKIKVKKQHTLLKAFFTIMMLGGLLAAAAWFGLFMLPGERQFAEKQVELSIGGPTKNKLGAETSYNIVYKNNQKIKLNNATLVVNYPEGFVFTNSSAAADNAGHTEWDIGDILPKQTGNITITGQNYGTLNQENSWRVFLRYRPENFNSELQKVAVLNTVIDESPLNIAITGPDKVAIGGDSEFTFAINNEAEWWPEQLELIPVLPANFYLTSSSPALNKTKKWVINGSTLEEPLPSLLTFKALGKFGDSADAATPIKATLHLSANGQQYQIEEADLNVELIKNSVSLNLAINGSLKNISSQPGDILNITLNIKNTTDSDLKKATVKLTLDAPSLKKQSILDWAELVEKHDADIQGTQISDDLRRGSISWTSRHIKDLHLLKSGQDINIDVRLPVKDSQTFNASELKEYKINAGAEMEFTDQTGAKQIVASNPIIITLNSDLKFEVRDEVSSDEGEKEEHIITWVLTNNFHPLKNLVLGADIYGDISWQEPTEVPAGEVKFDSSAKRLTWTIAEMPESVDVLALPFKIILNNKNPTQNTLVSRVHAQAEDAVTGEKLDFMGDEVMLK